VIGTLIRHQSEELRRMTHGLWLLAELKARNDFAISAATRGINYHCSRTASANDVSLRTYVSR